MGEIFSYFTKLRDFKLQLSVFLVSFGVIWFNEAGIYDIGGGLIPWINIMLLVSGLAVLYSLLEWVGRRIKLLVDDLARRRRDKQKRERLKNEIKEVVEWLDVYELRVLCEVRGHNAVHMKKYHCLASLRRKGVVNIISSSASSAFVEISEVAEEFFGKEGWQRFGEYKRVAAKRVFDAMPLADLKAFRPFVEKTLSSAPRDRGRPYALPSFKIYNRYMYSSIFSRVELNRSYHIDEDSRDALIEVFPARVES